MTETQKLREALQAISHIDDTTNHSVDASAALDRIGQIARQALALPTAAPVGEREAFEREMSKLPFEFCMDRWPDDGSYAWPGNYAAYHTQCAWDAWQALAALSAGDAGKFNKLFEAMDEGRASIIVEGDTRSIDGGEIYDALDALDAAIAARAAANGGLV